MRENGVPEFPDPDPATGAIPMGPELKADGATMRKASEKYEGVGPAMIPAAPGK